MLDYVQVADLFGWENRESPAATHNARNIVVVVKVRRDHRAIADPDARRDLAVQKRHHVTLEE